MTDTHEVTSRRGDLSYDSLYFPDSLAGGHLANPESHKMVRMRQKFFCALAESLQALSSSSLDPFGSDSVCLESVIASSSWPSRVGSIRSGNLVSCEPQFLDGRTLPPKEFRRHYTSPLPFRKPPITDSALFAPVSHGDPYQVPRHRIRRQTLPSILYRPTSLIGNSSSEVLVPPLLPGQALRKPLYDNSNRSPLQLSAAGNTIANVVLPPPNARQ
eukprot:Gregarina_sp_Poly_1__5617@NODE_2963_length_1498_cov_47_598882_g1870_i0_p1_GENE_NODE_2963_length_1498_cov_47_598882_g1870_i0NODE_2963_length_1498_cov_47_598882_g1870_i0_p1_ORF_typecomplete_len216_score20_88_NODE_2963_length_1498_cov_47_598882_g1870_i0183830